MKCSKNIDISNKISVKDYGKPKIFFSSLLLFWYREKIKSEIEKRNVTVTLRNAEEKNQKDLEEKKEKI